MFYHGNHTIYWVAAGPSDILAEYLKAAGDIGIIPIMDLTNDKKVNKSTATGEKAMRHWEEITAKLLDQGMRVCKKIINTVIREHISIDSMQFGFMEGRETTSSFIHTGKAQ